MDVFYEESALVHNSEKKQKKYNVLTVISTIFLVLGILWIIIGFYTVDVTLLGDWIIWGFICVWLFLCWFMLRMWKMRINVSYDYAFVSGELRISKVINVNKRKLVARIDCEDMIQFGDAENPSFERFRSDPNVKTVICTSNDEPEAGKFFMYALVCRFGAEAQYVKNYIKEGKMGKILSADGARMASLSKFNGWFNCRAKGGGVLIDAAIHELDLMLYLMGYPKPKCVLAFSDNSNKDLLNKVKSEVGGWKSADKNTYERDIEDFIRGFVTFEDGACLSLSATGIFRITEARRYIEINGDTAGARLWANGKNLEINEITEDMVERNFEPKTEGVDGYSAEINYFIDCCGGKENDMCPPREAVRLMEIIDAFYKSADTGLPVMM